MKVIDIKQDQRSSFKLNPLAAVSVLAMASIMSANVAQANGAYGSNTDITGAVINVPTFYANSPQGIQPAFDLATHAPSATVTIDTGKPLRKFVDPLAGTYNGLDGAGIPVAIMEKWVDGNTIVTGDDYLEIAVVEYTEQMHSDLAGPTHLRGYVQVETPAIVAGGLKDITGLIGSEHIPATYPDGKPIYKWKKNAAGVWAQSTEQVFWVHQPHYLGPVIVAFKGHPVRIKYTNYMPYHDATGKAIGDLLGGDLPIPTDEIIAGGGPIVNAQGGVIGNFPQNRAVIHWHGGDSPWISDGTPHQWIVPAGDRACTVAANVALGMCKGASFQNVPDMADPGPGSGTLYFPNNLSGRLMMYHDHTSGITKLNVYEGEAAGYVVVDLNELSMVSNAIKSQPLTNPAGLVTIDGVTLNIDGVNLPVGILDSVGIPLVIQDKTFVPKNIGKATDPNTHAADGSFQSQDAKWDTTHWGHEGDLWFPHVYETNQDPNSIDGTNPVGRWDWGPWFWPVFPSQYSLPSGEFGAVTQTPEAFMDTSVVNGQVYPTMTVDPKTYRFRILSVGNDRTIDLSLFKAVDAAGVVCDANNTNPAIAPLAPGQPAVNTTTGLTLAQSGALAACTEVRMVPAIPTAGFPASWPVDGRVGGVPDPATAGPDIVQIGNEGGLLPAPAILKAQPVSYDTNVRSITILNVLNHGLLLGGGERADVLVDFSQFAGQTLILYNDAPAPMPGLDPRIDYYTGAGDHSGAGGAQDTLPGYGPNTRTVMQIVVKAIAPAIAATATTPAIPAVVAAAPLDTTALALALPVTYAASQPKPIIPEVVYNAPFGTSAVNNYASIFTGSASKPLFSYTTTAVSGVTVAAGNGGSGYTTAPTVVFSGGGGGSGATATANLDPLGTVTSITVNNSGSAYASAPTATLSGGVLSATGVAATATALTAAIAPIAKTLPVINKAIQELFDPTYGRMNATLAVELPFTSALTATTIPLAYIDTPVDSLDGIKDGETQIWKITHNGVDSHPVHFHMVNVQVVNRVDWAGTIKPPEANELGWKETLRMNPLEDVYIAVKAKRPVTPFGVQTSSRLLDPSQAAGSTMGFTQINPLTGAAPAAPYSNVVASFDNEYVWHCHILGHEENDFMRPFVFHPTVMRPDKVTNLTLTGTKLSWTDPTPFGGVDVDGVPTAGTNALLNYTEPTNNPKNEIGFRVTFKGNPLTTLPANTTSLTVAAGNKVGDYTVVAFNVAGTSTNNHVVQVAPVAVAINAAPIVPAAAATVAATAAAAPTGLTQILNADGTMTLNWTAVPGATGYTVSVIETPAPVGGVVQLPLAAVTISVAATLTSYTTGVLNAGSTYAFAVTATTLSGTTAAITTGLSNSPTSAPVAFTGVADAAGSGSITLTWANNPLNNNNVSGLLLTWTTGTTTATSTFAPTTSGATVIGLTPAASYSFTLQAISNVTAFNSAVTAGVAVVAP